MAYTKTEWSCGDKITADKLNNIEDGIEEALECCGGTEGYSCETSYQQLLNENITTVTDNDFASADITADVSYSGEWTFDTLRVTFNGTEYVCDASILIDGGFAYYAYGASFDAETGTMDWSEYPFGVSVGYNVDQPLSARFFIATQYAGTHSVKIENPTEIVETSECFEKAVSTLLLQNIADAPNGGIVEGNIQDSIPQEGRNIATGLNAHAEGGLYGQGGDDSNGALPTQALGIASHAEGYGTTASGNASHAEGTETTASGDYSHAEGFLTKASGDYSHAEGSSTEARGIASHSEGSGTKASGDMSHAEGSASRASGRISHSEGSGTKASGDYSHAEGSLAEALGIASHAEGSSTVAKHKSQHVFGEHNIPDPSSAQANARGTYVEIVGNGVGGSGSGSLSNARTLDWNGNEWLAGNLTLGSTTLTEAQLQALLALL